MINFIFASPDELRHCEFYDIALYIKLQISFKHARVLVYKLSGFLGARSCKFPRHGTSMFLSIVLAFSLSAMTLACPH